jgi:hypothetical protein
MKEKWMPHIIAAEALAVFIVLGLACASAPKSTPARMVKAYEIQTMPTSGTLHGKNISKVKVIGQDNSRFLP